MRQLNIFHLYINEDEAWRVEISGFPELTEVAAKRGHDLSERHNLQPAYGSGPYADSKTSTGNGFYTRDDFLEILQYATERHIQIIPTVNFPIEIQMFSKKIA